MPLVNAYHKVIENMVDEYAVRDLQSQDPSNPNDWLTVSNTQFKISTDVFNRVVNDLVNIGAIVECNRWLGPDGTEESGISHDEHGNVNVTADDQHVDYVVQDVRVLRRKLEQIIASLEENESVINAIEENEVANRETANHAGFCSYGNGSVTYNGVPLQCRRQIKLLFKTLLENHGHTTTYEDIKLGIDRPDLDDATINKYIGELRDLLEDLIDYNPITLERGIGQNLTFRQ